MLTTVDTWNGAGTVLTMTPNPAFPSGTNIIVSVSVTTADGLTDINGSTFFSTSGSSSSSNTNRITTFAAGKLNEWDQYSTAAPVLDTNIPFFFSASTLLASNRTATGVTLMLPTGSISNLATVFGHPEDYNLFYYTTVSNNLNTTFPNGTYTFQVNSTQSNQTVAVSLPASLTQPPAPHVSNWTAAQNVNTNAPFTLTWDAWAGAALTDSVYVAVGPWNSAQPGTTGALPGTTTSVNIPAGALQANSNYVASIGFYRGTWTSNVTYVTATYRATITQFNFTTAGSGGTLPVVSNPRFTGGLFGFDVATSIGQQITAVYSTNISLPLVQWQTLLTTNPTTTTVHFVDPHSVTNKSGFYRVRNGT